MSIRDYRDLQVWQKAMDLVDQCYHLTKQFPQHEIYSLTNQIRRAAVSIPANVAEGRSRRHAREFLQHLGIASGSLSELETLMLISARLGYVSTPDCDDILERTGEIGKMLHGLKAAITRERQSSDT
jgi:four helix bundle protein